MKKIGLMGCLAWVLIQVSLQAQINVDSIRQILPSIEEDSTRTDLYIKLAEAYYAKDPQLALKYVDSAVHIGTFSKPKLGQAKINYFYGAAYTKLNQFDTATMFLEKALPLFKSVGEVSSTASTYYQLGDIARRKSEWDAAVELFLKAHDLYESVGKEGNMAGCYNALGIVYKNINLPEKAIASYQEALTIFERLNRLDGMSSCLLNIGNLQNKNGQYEEAEKTLRKSEKVAEQMPNNLSMLSYIYSSLGITYTKLEQHQKALLYYQRGYDIRKKHAKPDELSNSQINLAKTHLQIGNAGQAKRYFEMAITLGDENGIVEALKSGHKGLAEVYAKERRYAQAYEHEQLAFVFQDSLAKNEVSQQVVEISTKYEIEKKEGEIALLNASNKINTIQLKTANQRNIALIGGLLLFSVLSFFLYRLYRRIQSQNKIISSALVEKDTLLREIHHRVKNNLQLISSLLSLQSRHVEDETALVALKEGQNRVQSMALIHQNLYQEENLRGIDVQQYFEKLTENLFNSYNIAPDLIKLKMNIQEVNLDVDTIIPIGLIVNELISNALKHAFSENESGQISVQLEERDEQLLLTVADNGRGIDQTTTPVSKQSFGYRLIKTFKSQLDADLEIDGSNGTTVKMIIRDYDKAA